MHSIRRIPFVVTLLIVVNMTPLGLPVRTPAGQATQRTIGLPPDHIHASPCPGAARLPGHPARPSTGARKGHAE